MAFDERQFVQPKDPSRPARRVSRRAFLRAGAATLAGATTAGLAACGPRSESVGIVIPTPTKPFTPVGGVAGFDNPDKWAGRTLRVGAWGGDVQEVLRIAVWEPFAELTGCVVEPVITDFTRLEETLARNDPYADVLLVDSTWAVSASRRNNVLAPIDDTLAETAQCDIFPVSRSAVPAYSYGMVSAYRRSAIPVELGPPADWAAWWDTTRYPGSRTLFKGALGTFEFALLASGVPPEDLYPLDGQAAIESLKEISGRIVDRWWETGPQPVGWLGRGRADLGSAWSYRVRAAQIDGWPVEIVWNQGLLITDLWVVPNGTLSYDVAMDYIRFALSPEVQRSLAERLGFGPVNSEAFALMDPLAAAQLPSSPTIRSRMIMLDSEWWADNEVLANEQFNQWLLGV